MRTIALVVVLTTMSMLVHGQQNFTEPAAFWTVARTYPAGAPEDPDFVATTTRRFHIIGDSLVGGELWSIFISEPTHPDGDPPQSEGLARQEGGVVLGLRADLTLDTLYDFSLQIGDSTHYLIDGWFSTWLHVIAVDSILIQSTYHRIIDFEEVLDPPSVLHERWISGIGSIHGPLFPSQPITFATEFPDSLILSCYGIDDSVLWDHPSYDGCSVNFLLAINETASNELRVFPNPGSDQLTFKLIASEVSTVVVHDVAGRVVLQPVSIFGTTTIDASGWPQGVYQILMQHSDGNTRTVKWVKQ